MAKVLVDLKMPIEYVESWFTNRNGELERAFEPLANSARLCQIEDAEFDINTTSLAWVECNADVNVNDYYYDKSDSTIKLIPHASKPSE